MIDNYGREHPALDRITRITPSLRTLHIGFAPDR
jgi:hypothetical protein